MLWWRVVVSRNFLEQDLKAPRPFDSRYVCGGNRCNGGTKRIAFSHMIRATTFDSSLPQDNTDSSRIVSKLQDVFMYDRIEGAVLF